MILPVDHSFSLHDVSDPSLIDPTRRSEPSSFSKCCRMIARRTTACRAGASSSALNPCWLLRRRWWRVSTSWEGLKRGGELVVEMRIARTCRAGASRSALSTYWRLMRLWWRVG